MHEIDISKNWLLFSSRELASDSHKVSLPGFDVKNQFPTDIPSTVMAALVRNHVYKDVYFGDNLDHISGEPFRVPWWYRKSFHIDASDDPQYYRLLFEGLIYRANIWLNGTRIADSNEVQGCFRMFEFDATAHLKPGENILALEVFPPEPGDLSIGFVDWNPWPPDQNMGVWRPVKLLKTGAVSLKNVFVKPNLNVETLKSASLTVSAEITNHSPERVAGRVELEIEHISLYQEFVLQPNGTRKLYFSPSGYPDLNLNNPRIWWPVHLGEPDLYTMNMRVMHAEQLSDQISVRFGIRHIQDYFNDNGHRGFKINGKDILIKGGGWVDDLFLDDSDEKVQHQIRYVKHMNLNTIRLEGFWGRNQTLYDSADEHGILVMIGWSCQWEWQDYCGRPDDDYLAIRTPEEIEQHSRAYLDQVKWLRNHPSVFCWVYGSDKLLVPALERRLNALLDQEDGTRPILNSCGSAVSEITGKSGVKMNGPYGYVTPNYWYVDEHKGGAFGFNTETGPGVQPAPLESIKKMIPKASLWPMNKIWDYHLGRREFTTFEHWMKPFNSRYGSEDSVETFTFKAQMANYEAMRAMFEAFHVNRPNATGIIQWMLNSAMPGMLWQLYDWYLMPNGAFYGAKNGCRPLNMVYHYKDHSVCLNNNYLHAVDDLSAEIRMLSIDGKELFFKTMETRIGANQSSKLYSLPVVQCCENIYFLDLRLKTSVSKRPMVNFYWLSTKPDVLDYESGEWFLTANSSFADFTAINRMDKVQIKTVYTFVKQNEKTLIQVDLENPTDGIAFFIELSVKDSRTGLTLLPVFWEDNYISLLPGEKRRVGGWFFTKSDQKPMFEYQGWNMQMKT